MAFVLANIRSYLPKRESVEAFLDDHGTDIAIFTESWLSDNISDEELLDNNKPFFIYRRDRASRRGGGVLVFIKTSLNSSLLMTHPCQEILCIRITLSTSTCIVIACYRPPDSDSSFIADFYSVLLVLNTRFPKANYILCGDFNFPDIDWGNLSTSSRQAKDFLDVVMTFNLTQAVNFPTRGSNTLDLVFASSPELIQYISSTDGFSDHNTVIFNYHSRFPNGSALLSSFAIIKGETSPVSTRSLRTFFFISSSLHLIGLSKKTG